MSWVTKKIVLRVSCHSPRRRSWRLPTREIVQRSERFVHQPDGRPGCHHRSQGDSLSHPAGEFPGPGICEFGQPDVVERLVGYHSTFLFRHATRFERELDIVPERASMERRCPAGTPSICRHPDQQQGLRPMSPSLRTAAANPASTRSRVVFPCPDRPITATSSPARTVSDTSSSALHQPGAPMARRRTKCS